jgi:hypothetical protein
MAFQSKIKSSFKILDLDIECRPLSWYGGDFVTKEVTAIACKFIGQKEIFCWLLGENSAEEMFDGFLELYKDAGMLTGHYIRGFDLPTINGALTEYGYNPLDSKLTQDTKIDLIKRSGMSGSQENIAAMFGLAEEKTHMNQKDWRMANRLTKEGIARTKERVITDILQHEAMRHKLLESNMLGPPKMWSSIGQNKPKYFS